MSITTTYAVRFTRPPIDLERGTLDPCDPVGQD
jgi:hypothetical protein